MSSGPDVIGPQAIMTATRGDGGRVGEWRAGERWRGGRAVVGVVALVGLVGLMARVLVLRSPIGNLNADEAYVGVEAFEVLAGRFPVVLGGSNYTAVFEAYLYAPIVVVFGSSIWTLKMIPILMWWLASLVTARIVWELLSGRRSDDEGEQGHTRMACWAGVSALVMMWVAPGSLLEVSTRTYASYASGMLVVALAFLLSSRLVDRVDPHPASVVLVGFLAGLGFWMHPMVLSVLVPILAVVVIVHRHRATRRVVWPSLVAGGLVGSGPYLVWNLANGFESRSLPAQFEGSYADRLGVFWRELFPRAFGLRDAAMQWHLPIGVAFALAAVLLAATIAGAVIVWRRGVGPSRILLAVVLASVLPLMALFPPLIFSADGRYGIIALPFVVVAISATVAQLLSLLDDRLRDHGRGRRQRTAVMVGAAAVLTGFWAMAYVAPEGRVWLSVRNAEANSGLYETLELLDEAGINHFFGSWWAMTPVEFVADRRAIGGTFGFEKRPFERRAETVLAQAATGVAFIVEPRHDNADLLFMPADRYRRYQIGNTIVLVPTGGP